MTRVPESTSPDRSPRPRRASMWKRAATAFLLATTAIVGVTSAALGHLERLLRESKSDADLLAVAQARLRETQMARAAGRVEDAVRLAETGLARIDELAARTGSTLTETGVELLRAYAELVLFGGARSMTLARDLGADLSDAHAFMARHPSRRFRDDRTRFELYLALLRTQERGTRAHPSALPRVR